METCEHKHTTRVPGEGMMPAYFECRDCGKQFTEEEMTAFHDKQKKTGWTCDLCGKEQDMLAEYGKFSHEPDCRVLTY